ncbi:hypothetical protein SY27_11650 [Flavobacterium sp. 316]|uniref:hypothetical protein n=1 Tax=Flavobacterium sp. 316 TaxID=1603293 RepID=UPI0005E3F8F9|nr:hypothetical protein [Flavobacterium sp. 316]KIX20560.1 hypothetical protein SY27_11650 [Flavobacterium sp. 316]
MKHTEKQILEITKKTLKEIFKDLYKESDIEQVVYNGNKELIRGENTGKNHPCWVAIIKSLFDSVDFLVISDETGEPLYIQGKYTTSEIEKDQEGNYYRKEN